jgi:hypothetical protein
MPSMRRAVIAFPPPPAALSFMTASAGAPTTIRAQTSVGRPIVVAAKMDDVEAAALAQAALRSRSQHSALAPIDGGARYDDAMHEESLTKSFRPVGRARGAEGRRRRPAKVLRRHPHPSA